MRTHCRSSLRFLYRGVNERGAILIVVLVVALGLVTVTVYFAQSVNMEYRAGDNRVADLEAQQICDGARRYIVSMLKNQETPGFLPETNIYQSDNVTIGEGRFWIIGRDPNQAAVTDRPAFGLIDEASKLNLNTATEEMLEALPNMTAELAAAILDWRDSNEEVRPNGAETETYALLDSPYAVKNSDFETPEELRLIYGMDMAIIYGDDLNRNGLLDSNENDGEQTPPLDNQDGKLDSGILEYVTVWSREPNKRDDGSQRINISNAQGQEPLRTLLRNTFGQARAQQIMQAIGQQPLGSPLEFYLRSGLSSADFAQVEDALTTTNDEMIRGRININTAPEAVLTAIPGIGSEKAIEIVNYRQGKTADDLKSIAWVSEVLDRPNAIQAGPFLTTRSYQFTADIVGVGHLGRGMHRNLYVIDTADGEARVVYRREMGRAGWPLGQAIRSEIRSAMISGK